MQPIQEIIFWSRLKPEEKEEMIRLWNKIPEPLQKKLVALCAADVRFMEIIYKKYKKQLTAVIDNNETDLRKIFDEEDDYLKNLIKPTPQH